MPIDINDLIDEIDGSINEFNKSIEAIQKDVLNKVELFIKELEVKNGKITSSLSNLRKINALRPALERAVLSPAYKKKVAEFAKSFNTITEIQNTYFSGLTEEFTTKAVYDEVKNIAITDTIYKLTETGLRQGVIDKAADIVRTNITSKANYSQLLTQVKSFLTNDETGDGALVKYSKQITTDALNQYAGNYTKLVTDDLGLEWFGYNGALVEGSRDFCRHLVKKRFFHKSEIPGFIKGIIDGVKIPVNPKNGLPIGMIPGTNATNFMTLRGGYQCNHLATPVSKFRVPKELRAKFEKA